MNLPFRVEKKASFDVIGYSIKTTNKGREGRRAVPLHWHRFKEENLKDTLLPLMNREPYGILGINVYNVDESDPRIFEYFIAVSNETGVEKYNGTLDTYRVPEALWAVFPCTVETIAKTEVQAISKWLPKSAYKPLNSGYITGRMKSGAPDIEYYGEDGLAEVWIAVREK